MHVREVMVVLDGGRVVKLNPNHGYEVKLVGPDKPAHLYPQEVQFLVDLMKVCNDYRNHFHKEPTHANDHEDQDEAPPGLGRPGG
jgi:hypothetical protein